MNGMASGSTGQHHRLAFGSLALLVVCSLIIWQAFDSSPPPPVPSPLSDTGRSSAAGERTANLPAIDRAHRTMLATDSVVVRDAENGEPIGGVELLGATGEIFAVTDSLGAFSDGAIPAGDTLQLFALHPDFAITPISLPRTDDVQLRRRPAIRCWLKGVDASDVQRHDFDIEVASSRDPQIRALGLEDVELGPRVQSWGGDSPVGVDHYGYGDVVVKLTVRKTGTEDVVRRQRVQLTLDEREVTCPFVIAPPLPKPARLGEDFSAVLDITFWFPIDEAIQIEIEGPLMKSGGPVIDGTGMVSYEARANEPCTIPLTQLGRAYYRWSARVRQHGTYRGGEFEVHRDGERLTLQNDRAAFYRTTIRIAPPPARTDFSLSWHRDGKWCGGTQFPAFTTTGEYVEYPAIAQRGRRNWVKASAYLNRSTDVQTRTVEVTPDRPTILLDSWQSRELHMVLRPTAQRINERYWLDVTNVESGMIRQSAAKLPTVPTYMMLSEGIYDVVVHSGDREICQRQIAVPACGKVVDL